MSHVHRSSLLPARLAVALLVLAATGAAACRKEATTLPGPRATATNQGAELAAQDTPDASAILRTCREAMSRLSSFEGHQTTVVRFEEGDDVQVYVSDYRFEAPDRHTFVVHGSYAIDLHGAIAGLADSDVSESIRIGSSYWTRGGYAGTGQWVCEPYNIEPPELRNYAPPDGATLVGVQRTSLGTWYRFRSDPSGEWWIDATTFLVSRFESAAEVDGRSEINTTRLDAFDTPATITAPGPCVPATNTAVPAD